MKIYAHKPIPKTDLSFGTGKDKIVYKCNAQGIIMIPEIIEKYNPIEEVKIKPVKTVKKTVAKD